MHIALMIDNNIESSLKFLNSGMSPRDLAKHLGVLQHSTDGFL